jgi:hypothetical protein
MLTEFIARSGYDRIISNVNNVVAEIVTTAPYKEIHKELENKKK